MEQTQISSQRNRGFKLKEPPMYNVIMHNDDETTMDFVVMVLIRIFRKTHEDAEKIMMTIHTEGSAMVGTYTKDIAQSKSSYTMILAKKNGFPLTLTLEQA